MSNTIRLKIRRKDSPQSDSYWEEFEIPHKPSMNVISALVEIARNPVNAEGKTTRPVVWESSCLEEVCGACSMIINGKARQACSALIEQLEQPIVLEPFSKFPCIRDLRVDRTQMFDALKRVKAWVPLDGTHDLGPGPRQAEKDQLVSYDLSRCMTCGCCLEVCPQVSEHSDFIGAAAVSQVRLFNMHPTGAMNKHERLDALMGPGGLADCGNAQNCVKACPKEIPLTTSIAEVGRELTKRMVEKIFG
ncbi:MAG: succinate dehydrogenase iron-sulfur subunit [Deltaproteobacteria bacterium]|nr:succinate dehydrogenase iron-sulfur subunit [Deltaproteobacteria bacterium]